MNHYLGEPIMTSEYYPVFLFIYLKVILAQIFGLCRLSFMNNTKSLFDFIYLKVALCPLWLKSLVLISVHSWFNFVPFVSLRGETKIQNEPKTNPNEPKRTQFFGGQSRF